MSGTTLALTIDVPELDGALSWNALESLVVAMSHEVPVRALALALEDAQERLVELACGARWSPVPGESVPFACPGCGAREGFVRKGKRTRPRKLRTAAGTVELIVWHVGCSKVTGCGRVFSPLLVMLGLSGRRRTDRLTLDLAELGTQMSFARSAAVDRMLAGTGATAGQAHAAMADIAALLAGDGEPDPSTPAPSTPDPDETDPDDPSDDPSGGPSGGPSTLGASAGDLPGGASGEVGTSAPAVGDTPGAGPARDGRSFFVEPPGAPPRAPSRVLGPAITRPLVVMLDGTGTRAGAKKNGVPVNLAIGLTGRSGPLKRRQAHTHLLGLTVDEDWSMMGAQLQGVAAPELVVVDGEHEITALAQRLWPTTAIQRCWWHLPHGLRKAFYADDAANRHVNPNWARTTCNALAELLRDQIRHEHTTSAALAAWDEFTATIPDVLTAAHTYLDTARPHAFTCLEPAIRRALAPIGGPELGTGVIERLMREINARTDIGGVRWTTNGLRDTLTVTCARIMRHPAWTQAIKNIRPPSTITFSLQKFNAA